MTRYIPAFPKPIRETDPDYLRFIRRQGCVVHPQIAAEAHHMKTRGAGGSDYTAVGLCRRCYVEITQRGQGLFEMHHGVDLAEELNALLIRYLSAFKEGVDLGAK